MPLWARPAAAAGASDTARQARFLRADSAGGERGPGRPSRAWLPARRGLARRPALATSALGCGLGAVEPGKVVRRAERRTAQELRRNAVRTDPGASVGCGVKQEALQSSLVKRMNYKRTPRTPRRRKGNPGHIKPQRNLIWSCLLLSTDSEKLKTREAQVPDMGVKKSSDDPSLALPEDRVHERSRATATQPCSS
ncbi:hypothetical protein H8959_001401 [Pygathrix nigripes]